MGDERPASGVRRHTAATAGLDEPVTFEDGADGRGRRQRRLGVPPPRAIAAACAGPPRGVLLACGDDEGLDLGWRGGRVAPRGVRAVGQRLGAAVGVARDPFVGGLAADAGAGGELGDGVEGRPEWRATRWARSSTGSVTVQGTAVWGGPCGGERGCHPSSRSDLLPLVPVCTTRMHNPPLQADTGRQRFRLVQALALP